MNNYQSTFGDNMVASLHLVPSYPVCLLVAASGISSAWFQVSTLHNVTEMVQLRPLLMHMHN